MVGCIKLAWRNLLRGVQNLVIWFPVIWKDRYWDYVFLFILMHHKLRLMEKGILKNAIHVNYQRDALQIKRCRLLLERLIDSEVYHNHEIKAKLFGVDKQDYVTSDNREKFDLEYLFKYMTKHIRGWWD